MLLVYPVRGYKTVLYNHSMQRILLFFLFVYKYFEQRFLFILLTSCAQEAACETCCCGKPDLLTNPLVYM